MLLEGDTSYRLQILVEDKEVMRFLFDFDELEQAEQLFNSMSCAFTYRNPPAFDGPTYSAVKLLGLNGETIDFSESRCVERLDHEEK